MSHKPTHSPEKKNGFHLELALPFDLLARVEAHRERMNRKVPGISRQATLRALLVDALDRAERKA